MILTYPTALEYWLNADGFPTVFSSFENVSFAEALHIPDHFPFGLNPSKKLHAMVEKAGQRRVRENICFHLSPGNLPPDSLVKLSDRLYIVRPELCFLLAAQERSVPELVLLANNLCSIYRPDSSSRFEQAKRTPVTSCAKIKDYLERAKSVRGLAKALRAVRFASDRSNSPIESILAMLARLPLSLGGFGLPQLCLNYDIILSNAAVRFSGKESYCCDLVWPNHKVICEYDSSLAHLTRSQHNYDKKRTTALMMSGYTVINITWGQIENMQKVDLLFFEIRSKLGLKNYKERFQKYEKLRDQTIRQFLYNAFV